MASGFPISLRVPSSALGLAAVIFALGGLAFANTDALLEAGFERALAHTEAEALARARMATGAGSEDFWLRKPADEGRRIVPAASKPLAAGDRITIHSGGGAQVLEVVEISAVPDGLAAIATASPSSRLIVVTCRDADRSGAPLVRLVLDENGGWPVLVGAKAPRAL